MSAFGGKADIAPTQSNAIDLSGQAPGQFALATLFRRGKRIQPIRLTFLRWRFPRRFHGEGRLQLRCDAGHSVNQ